MLIKKDSGCGKKMESKEEMREERWNGKRKRMSEDDGTEKRCGFGKKMEIKEEKTDERRKMEQKKDRG
jgi:hypothetical protein